MLNGHGNENAANKRNRSRVRFFTKIQDPIKIRIVRIFRWEKKRSIQKNIIIHWFPNKGPTISTVSRRKNNTAADSLIVFWTISSRILL